MNGPKTWSFEEYHRRTGVLKPLWLDLFWEELATDPRLTSQEQEEMEYVQSMFREPDYSAPLALQVFRCVQSTGEDAFLRLNSKGETNHELVDRVKAWLTVKRERAVKPSAAGTVIHGAVRTSDDLGNDSVLHFNMKQDDKKEVR